MRERIAGDFTLDDAAVCLYTFDFRDYRYEMSPYNLLNRALHAEKNVVKEIVKVRDVLYLVMTALKHTFLSSTLFLPPCLIKQFHQTPRATCSIHLTPFPYLEVFLFLDNRFHILKGSSHFQLLKTKERKKP